MYIRNKLLNTSSMLLAAASESGRGVEVLNHSASAVHAGEMIPETINQFVTELVIKKEDVKLGPLDLKFMLEDAEFDFAIFPLLESESGNNPHYYPSTNSKGRDVQGDWFKDYYKGTPTGKVLVAKLADAELALSKENSHQSKMYADKVGNTLFLEDEIAMLKARITSGGNYLKNAAGVQQMETAFTEKLDGKKVLLTYNVYDDADGKEQMKRTNNPFVISEPGKPGNFTRLNVGQFLKLNLDQALDNGGTYGAVIATLRKSAGGTKDGKFKIGQTEESFSCAGSIAEYYDYGSDRGRKHIEAARKLLRKDSSDEYVLNMGDAVMALDTMWGEFEDRYQKLSKARDNATRDLNKVKAA